MLLNLIFAKTTVLACLLLAATFYTRYQCRNLRNAHAIG